MDRPFAAYEGDAPYIFVSYAHADDELVLPEMSWIRDAGFNLWYDDGIHVGSVWRQSLADALDGSAGLIFMATEKSVVSDICLKELNFVLDDKKPVFVVQLDKTPLPNLLRLSLSDRQALIKSDHNEVTYRAKLVDALGALTEPHILVQDENPKQQDQRAEPSNNRFMLGVFGLAGLLLMGALAFFLHTSSTSEKEVTLVVLPFENLSPDPKHEYFSTGIQEEIMLSIAKDTDILIMGRRSVLQYDGSTKPASVIAAELAVDYLLTGSVRYENDKVRINLQLVDETGIEQWSKNYDRTFADIFAIQRDVATQVAHALKASFVGTNEATVVDSASKAKAYQEYLLAYHMQVIEIGKHSSAKIVEQINRALHYDADQIPALRALHNMYQNGYASNTRTERIEMMRKVGDRAYKADPEHPMALALKAKEMMWDLNWSLAMDYWEQAIEVDPGDSINLAGAAWAALALDNVARAVELSDSSIRFSDGNFWPKETAISIHKHLGNSTEVKKQEDRYVADHPLLNETREIIAEQILDAAFNGDSSQINTFDSFLMPEEEIRRLKVIATILLNRNRQGYHKVLQSIRRSDYCRIGIRYAIRMEMLEEAAICYQIITNNRKIYDVVKLATDPQYSPLRSDPRFIEFLKQNNLSRFATLRSHN
jgi:TolB-like protein